MAEDALSSALAALGLHGGGDAAATLSALPDPLVLRILTHLDGPDLARLAAGADQRMRQLAATEALWAPLCSRRWGAACSAELYNGSWQACYAARHALPARLLSCYDRAAALASRLEAGAPAEELAARRDDGAALAQTAWASCMFLCNADLLARRGAPTAPGTPAQVAAWAQSREHAAFRENMLRALRSPAGAAAVWAYLEHAAADALEYDLWGGRGFFKFADVPMRRSAAEFLLAEPLEARSLAPEAAAALTARLAALDDAIASAAAEAHALSVAPPEALPYTHAARWWHHFAPNRPSNAC